jgi:signal transduction histidine kinase
MPVVPGGAGPAAVVGEPRIRDGAGDSGRAQVMVSVPVSGAGGTLTAVYDAQDLLADLTRNEQPSFHLAVTGRSGVLYERRHVAHVVRWRRAAALDLHGSGWTLTLAPGREALDRELTWFPWVVAGSGLSLALLLCVALLQTRTARRHGRRAETALAGLRAEMVQRQLYEAELARSNAELERFAYVASHDLQEPLRQVASFVELLGQRYRGRLDADADDFIRYAVEGAHRLQRLIEDLLAYSRVGSRGRELEPTDASAALERALAHLELAIAEAGAVVEHEPLPRVMADEGQLVQVFQNLLSNAVKFHREGVAPRVRVTSRRADWMWEISVADNGIGIEAGYFERIFLIFQRLHGREEFPGTGIGLALARRIVERHGGRLWVESEPGQGSTFHFTLAAAGEEAP